MRPSPSRTSISSMLSCTRPWRCEEDSMPTPAPAPQGVMVFSCGPTAGITPCARHSATSASYVTIPSASTWPALIRRTSLKWRTSSRRRAAPARSRNRFEVSFASPTGPLPCLSRAAKASFFVVCRLFVEESSAHRIAGLRDVALGEHDLEQVRVPLGRSEHLGAAVQVDAPDPAEALVEALRIERADPLPVAVEALAPRVERERIVAG